MTDQEKIIYDILCSDEQPPEGQHWEGFVTNKIVVALAQPEPEPVAWADRFDIDRDGHDFWVNRQEPAKDGVPLYTAPPQREWVGLTDEEIKDILDCGRGGLIDIKKTEQKLKEKNGF